MRAAARSGVLAILLAAGVLSCARPMAPPGGERDESPPRLLSTTPGPLEVIAAGSTPAVFRFDERISERGFSEALVLVSPLDGALRVDRSGAEVRVQIDGGWRADRVYRIVLLPGVRDLFGNERRESVELVFSTGAPVGNTALAGVIIDRLTGGPAPLGVVDAVHAAQGARYTAIADSSGFYSLRYLPLGEYDVRAYDDQNRNRRRDRLEPVDSGYTVFIDQPTDTVALIFNVLSPDSTAPRIVGARALDSLHVRIEIDDYLDPVPGFDGVRAAVSWLPDSTFFAAAIRVVPEGVFLEEQRAVADTAVARDSARAPPDTADVPVPVRDLPPVLADQGQPRVSPNLPVRVIVVRLDRPLVRGTYTITVTGIVNLHDLAGGGSARFDAGEPEAQAPPPDVPPDTLRSSGAF